MTEWRAANSIRPRGWWQNYVDGRLAGEGPLGAPNFGGIVVSVGTAEPVNEAAHTDDAGRVWAEYPEGFLTLSIAPEGM